VAVRKKKSVEQSARVKAYFNPKTIAGQAARKKKSDRATLRNEAYFNPETEAGQAARKKVSDKQTDKGKAKVDDIVANVVAVARSSDAPTGIPELDNIMDLEYDAFLEQVSHLFEENKLDTSNLTPMRTLIAKGLLLNATTAAGIEKMELSRNEGVSWWIQYYKKVAHSRKQKRKEKEAK
jgi:hypothetical protein